MSNTLTPDESVHIHELWPYGTSGPDPMVLMWEACLRHWANRSGRFSLKQYAYVLELGCLESPWADLLRSVRPDITIVGLDSRPQSKEGPPWGGHHFLRGDAASPTVYPRLDKLIGANGPDPADSPINFDAIVALSAVEHFGLGWYGDPRNLSADRQAFSLAWARLKPGGWFYYDVPWRPDRPVVTDHYRAYCDSRDEYLPMPHEALHLTPVWQGWFAPGHEYMMLPGRPGDPPPDNRPFYYISTLLEKR